MAGICLQEAVMVLAGERGIVCSVLSRSSVA